jgi:hypothetical protein
MRCAPPETRPGLPCGRRTREFRPEAACVAHGPSRPLRSVPGSGSLGCSAAGRPGLRPGVGLAVGGGQPLDQHVGVDLRARQRGVAEDLLHAPQVGAALQEVGGDTYPPSC